MSCERSTIRQPGVNLLSIDATRELTEGLPLGEGEREIEFVVAIRRDGGLDYYIPNKLKIGDTLVQTDTCNGLCFTHEVLTEGPCQGGNQFTVQNGFRKTEVPCDAGIVKKVTDDRIADRVVPLAIVLYKNSGCACSTGGCLHM